MRIRGTAAAALVPVAFAASGCLSSTGEANVESRQIHTNGLVCQSDSVVHELSVTDAQSGAATARTAAAERLETSSKVVGSTLKLHDREPGMRVFAVLRPNGTPSARYEVTRAEDGTWVVSGVTKCANAD